MILENLRGAPVIAGEINEFFAMLGSFTPLPYLPEVKSTDTDLFKQREAPHVARRTRRDIIQR